MRTSIRVLLVAAVTMGAMGAASASASAVTVKDNGVTCAAIAGGPEDSGNPFTGGCAATGIATHSTLATPSETLDCTVEISDAVVSGDGSVGINQVIIDDRTAGNDAECDGQVLPCDLDPPILPWAGSISGTSDPFDFSVTFCVVTPQTGVVSGTTAGVVRNASGGNPPQIEFDTAAVGSSGATLDATFDLAPTTLSVE